MTQAVILSLTLLPGCVAAYAQTEVRPEFEVASIKPSQPAAGGRTGNGCRGGPGTNDPALLTCGNLSLSDLVMMAYRIPYYQMSAPEWMATTRFDLAARVPEGTTKERLAVMLQNLLADRFKLAVRHQSKDLQKYDLVVAKNGPRLKDYVPPIASKEEAPHPAPPAPITLDKDGYPALRGKMTMAIVSGHARMHLTGATMEAFVAQLSGVVGGPVTDATGLNGKYDISIFWIPEKMSRSTAPGPDGIPATPDPGPTLMQALQDQLGLRLEGKKGPVELLVIKHAERVPAAN